MFAEAVEESKQAVELSNGNPVMLAGLGCAYAYSGQEREARQVLARLDDLSRKRYVSSYHVALIYCALGERERALEWLEKTYAERDAWLIWISVEPQLDPLRTDARFQDLLRRISRAAA
jgi:Flp pilus assembly protein TadD